MLVEHRPPMVRRGVHAEGELSTWARVDQLHLAYEGLPGCQESTLHIISPDHCQCGRWTAPQDVTERAEHVGGPLDETVVEIHRFEEALQLFPRPWMRVSPKGRDTLGKRG